MSDRTERFKNEFTALLDKHQAEFHVENGKITVYLNAIPPTLSHDFLPQEEINFAAYVYPTDK